ncbi:MAG: TonB-dependent receptor [Candidatus Aminicenantes bacterium]|nr:TonB-dependent receptor [Candidatus Aminicenantes bacterium]
MKIMIKSGVFLLMLFVLFSTIISFAFAQEVEKLFKMDIEDLMDIKVAVASRSERSIKDLPSTVHIITREEILSNSYSSLVDALKDIPGVKVSQPGTGTHGEKYLMRGLWGNNYAKILVNGVPIRPSAVDGMPIGEQINMKNVERIEVVYGPASALYGADALAGIINIVTYNPEENTVLLETSVGTSGYESSKFFMNHTNKDLKLNIYGGYNNRDDLNIDKDGGAFSQTNLFGGVVKIGKLPSESRNIGMEILFKDFHLSFNHMYRSDPSSLEQDSRYYLWNNPDLIYGETIQKATINHNFNINKLRLNSFVSYLKYRLDTDSAFGMIYYPTPLYKFTASDDILLEESAIYDYNENLEFVGGLSYQYSGAMPKSNDLIKPFDEELYKPFSKDVPEQGIYQSLLLGDFGFNPLTYSNFAGFLQGTYSTKIFTLMLGIRYDNHSEYESKINPRIAGLYNINRNTSIRASYNKAFRAPPPYKVYNSIAVDNGDGSIFYIQVPNEDLEPERFSAVEVGLRHIFNKNTSLELIGYHNEISSLITSGRKELDPSQYPYADGTHANTDINSLSAKSILDGVDIIVSLNNVYEPMNVNASFYLSYMNGRETLPNGDKIDVFRNTPEILMKLRVNATPIESLYVGFDGIYCSEWYARIYSKADLSIPENRSDGYFTMDFIAQYKIPSEYGDFKLHLKVNNIFDASYGGFKYRDNPQYKRSFYFGIGYSF